MEVHFVACYSMTKLSGKTPSPKRTGGMRLNHPMENGLHM